MKFKIDNNDGDKYKIYEYGDGLSMIINKVADPNNGGNGVAIYPTAGANVSVHYTGYLEDGTIFDSSAGRAAFKFKLKEGRVIKGWDESFSRVPWMIGEERTVIIPSSLGYGTRGAGSKIPPASILIFDMFLEGIEGDGTSQVTEELLKSRGFINVSN